MAAGSESVLVRGPGGRRTPQVRPHDRSARGGRAGSRARRVPINRDARGAAARSLDPETHAAAWRCRHQSVRRSRAGTTTATGGLPARKRAGMGSPLCAAGTPPISTCATPTTTASCVSSHAVAPPVAARPSCSSMSPVDLAGPPRRRVCRDRGTARRCGLGATRGAQTGGVRLPPPPGP